MVPKRSRHSLVGEVRGGGSGLRPRPAGLAVAVWSGWLGAGGGRLSMVVGWLPPAAQWWSSRPKGMIVTAESGTDPLPPVVPAIQDTARQWADAVAAVAFLPAGRARTRAALELLLRELLAGVHEPALDLAAGQRVGARLVELRMSSPAAIGAATAVLAARLPHLVDDGPAQLRIPVMLGQLVAGFSTAQRAAAVRAAETLNRSEKRHWRHVEAQRQQLWQHQLLHDPASQLPNRAALHDHLTARISDPNVVRLGVGLVSIGDFAQLSDAHGDALDDLLAGVGARLGQLTAEHEHYLAAHLGDDLFAVTAATTSIDDLVKAADQARHALAGLTAGAYDTPVTLTCGLVEGPAAGTSAQRWIRDARHALGWARQDGHDRAVFDPARAAGDLRRQHTAAQMPEALDRGEFIAHFQPIVDLDTGRVTAVEALARWQRPDRLAGPDEFIALAETNGLIHRLGATILEQACQQAAVWRREGHDLTISVNVSPYQLTDPALPTAVTGALQTTGLPAGNLQLEITESAAAERHSDTLRDLANLGVRIALDDFGTGYANLAALTRLPVTCVKVDRRFVHAAAAGDSTNIALLRHLLGLFRRLNITAVAEGIETEAQQYLLTGLGYEYGQGLHLARPGSADTTSHHLQHLDGGTPPERP